MGDVRVSIIEIVVNRSKTSDESRNSFVAALRKMQARLEALLPNRREDILCGAVTNSRDVVQIAADICNMCTLNLNSDSEKVVAFSQAGYLICQTLFGMQVSKDMVKRFANLSPKNKRIVSNTFGFLNGFLGSVKGVPENIQEPLLELRDLLEPYTDSLDQLTDSKTSW
jgi:hypothetical protein